MARSSARPRKRLSASSTFETVPNMKQVQYTAPRTTKKDKHPPRSTPRRYQQTITQMDPFLSLFHPNGRQEDRREGGQEEDDDENNLEYDEAEVDRYAASPVGRKRRKIMSEEPRARRIATRSSARKSVKPKVEPQEDTGHCSQSYKENQALLSKPQTLANLMPPPQTPRKIKRREIPSSQSPADTPLSTQSRRSVRDTSRSPLKERSTNVTCLTSPSKKGRWARKLEVADSMETENSESSHSTPRKLITHVNLTTERHHDSGDKSPPQLPPPLNTTASDNQREVLETSQPRNLEPDRSSQPIRKEILDSDYEDDEDDKQEEVSNSLPANSFLKSIAVSPIALNQQPAPTPITITTSSPSKLSHTPIQKHHSPPTIHPDANDPILLDPDSDPEDSPNPTTQLINDLQRTTQPTTLQTESQFENAWVPYHAPSPLQSSSPSSMPAPQTIPTQPFLPSTTPISKYPVPPSQATTTDLTQPSPRKQLSSSSLAFPSSPPPMPPPMEKPWQRRRGRDVWAGFEWDGRRLTDSQLLPESLLDDGFGGGGLGCEEEELVEE